MNRLMRFDHDIKECFLLLLLPCVFAGCAWLCMVAVSLLAGSEPAVHPVFHFDMDTDDATQTSARTDEQHPWLEYSVWHDQEWVRIYTPGQDQLWHPEEAVPDLPDNSFREWKRVTDPDDGTCEPSQAWSIRDWQHQGYQRILSRYESFSTHHAPDQPLVDVQHPDIIRVEEMFTYAPPISDGDDPTSLQLPPVFYGGTRLAHLGDLSSPSSERPRVERAVSRSPHRCGYFGRR